MANLMFTNMDLTKEQLEVAVWEFMKKEYPVVKTIPIRVSIQTTIDHPSLGMSDHARLESFLKTVSKCDLDEKIYQKEQALIYRKQHSEIPLKEDL